MHDVYGVRSGQVVRSEMHHNNSKNAVKGSNAINFFFEVATTLEILSRGCNIKKVENR